MGVQHNISIPELVEDIRTPELAEEIQNEIATVRSLQPGREELTTVISPSPGVFVPIVSTTADGRKIIGFSSEDPENPHNWSLAMKYWISFIGILQVSNSTVASSIPSGAASFIGHDFGIAPDSPILTLPISLFLVGYVVGPLLFAPLSEFEGRKLISILAFIWFMLGSIGCALAPNMPALLVLRFLTGMGASACLSIVGAVYADIWDDPIVRGRCVSFFVVATTIGPVISPVVSGLVSAGALGWRFCFWITLIFAVITLIPTIWFCPETFAPKILTLKARRLRAATGDEMITGPAELDDRTLLATIKISSVRPFKMFFCEAIVGFTSIYVGLIYGTFYLFFQSYPIIFQGIYGFSPALAGIAFLPIGVGSCFAYLAVVLWDKYLHYRQRTNPAVVITDEYRRLPLTFIAGMVYCFSLFLLGSTAKKSIHYLVPMSAGLFFGFSFCLIFMSTMNYITDAYKIYSASAIAANSMCRSLFGAVLPVAARRMYAVLGVQWATSLLGIVAVFLGFVPLLFIKYGNKIREHSKFCRYLKEQEEKDKLQNLRNSESQLQVGPGESTEVPNKDLQKKSLNTEEKDMHSEKNGKVQPVQDSGYIV